MSFEVLENKRQSIQDELDKRKTQNERNAKGQFATPFSLANDIMKYAESYYNIDDKVRFLDPAIGTGSFYSALINIFSKHQIEAATGYEIDKHYGIPSLRLWKNHKLKYVIDDFTEQRPIDEEDKYNLIICNPPYVRHHHISDQKSRLQIKAIEATGIKLSGLSGLYCYFITIAHQWMRQKGIAGWLIPSEFMDVNYGKALKQYLLNKVTLLHIHRFDPKDIQFNDALVSSTIVWFRNEKPDIDNMIKFTFGGTLNNPLKTKMIHNSTLSKANKWTRFPLSGKKEEFNKTSLNDFFDINRGIATGDNKYFILSLDRIKELKLPLDQFKPILPSPRFLEKSEIESDDNGYPIIEHQLFVLDCQLPIEEIILKYPKLYSYLEKGIQTGVSNRYLCKNRKIWYSQEKRIESPFYFTYIGRNSNNKRKSLRFIFNHSKAIVTNSYLILYPKPFLKKEISKNPEITNLLFHALNNISIDSLIEEGRVYGGGMYKLEPKELANVKANVIARLLNHSYPTLNKLRQQELGLSL